MPLPSDNLVRSFEWARRGIDSLVLSFGREGLQSTFLGSDAVTCGSEFSGVGLPGRGRSRCAG
jgi:hypothetical protein